MVFAFQVEDQSIQDVRHGNVAYTLLVIYFPDNMEHDVLSKKEQLENRLLKIVFAKKTIDEINVEFLKAVSIQFHDTLSQIEQLILIGNIELILGKKGKKERG